MAESDFPCLRPIADARHGWVALALTSASPMTAARLSRLFGEQGLFDALGDLPCITALPQPPTDDLAGVLPAESVILRLDAEACRPGNWGALENLRAEGFRLLGDAGSDAAACPHIDHLAQNASSSAPRPAIDRPIHWLAESVASTGDFERCRQLGFSWFAGNYPLSADPNQQPQDGMRRELLLGLLGLLARDAESADIERLIKQDAHLSYQLLRLVNSVAFSLTREISSFGQAITLLGRRQLARWLQLLVYVQKDGGLGRSPLLPRAALRAALMEALAQDCEVGSAESAYMTGMFSLLDRLLPGAMTDLLAPLHLPPDVKTALIARSGPLGTCLQAVAAADRGDGPALVRQLQTLSISEDAWIAALVRGYRWAIEVSRQA